ncbi:hypothetical protein [Microbispora catharanthi]|nr:hypothetical protein [Microbispora catharanthi]
MLFNTDAALVSPEIDADWACRATTRIQAGLFTHLTTEADR